MKLSTRTRYGMRAMLDLALHSYEGNPVPAREIAERNGIPESFLEQLLRTLRQEDLVASIRGSQGGYILSRDPSEIKVAEIINALEGPISLADCLDETVCGDAGSCPSRILWSRIRKSIEKVTQTTTLEDLVLREPEKGRFKEDENEKNDISR